MLTLVTSGSTYASVTGGINLDLNVAFAKSDGDSGNGGDDGDSSKKSKDGSNDKNDKGDDDGLKTTTTGGSDNTNVGGSSDDGTTTSTPAATEQTSPPPTEATPPPPPQPTCPDGSLPDANGNCPPPASEQNALSTQPPQTNQQTCPDGSLPDANGNCPMPSGQQQLQQHLQSRPPQKIDDGFTSFSSKRSQSSQVPDVISTPSVDKPSSKNTGVGQPIQTDKTGNLLGPRSSQLQRTPDGVLTQKPKSNIGDLLGSSSSELQTELPKTTTTQKAPDTLFKGPKSVPGGSVPLGNPALVPAPIEEGGQSADDPCIVDQCNFPYPTSDDEICRNGVDDDHDGKVDEAYPCREVPGESKPRPSDGILTPIPGQPLGP